jgi:hypothetical protein
MGNDPERLRQSESAARDCIRAARVLDSLRLLYAADEDDAYRPCINEALSPLLHLLGELFRRCTVDQPGEQPWYEFDLEPTSEQDAEIKLRAFLDDAEALLDGPRPAAFCFADVRATTFALMLKDPDTT